MNGSKEGPQQCVDLSIYPLLWGRPEKPGQPKNGLNQNSETAEHLLMFGVLLPDTVIFQGGVPQEWYFTATRQSQQGRINKRHSRNCNAEEIEAVFSKQTKSNLVPSASNSFVKADVVAYFFSSSTSSVRYLNQQQLHEFLSRQSNNFQRGESGFLQRFVAPSSHKNEVVRADWTSAICVCERRLPERSVSDVRASIESRLLTYEPGTGNGCEAHLISDGSVLHNRIVFAMEQMVSHINQLTSETWHKAYGARAPKVCRMVMYFKKGTASKLWLLWCERIEFTKSSKDYASQQRHVAAQHHADSSVPHDVDDSLDEGGQVNDTHDLAGMAAKFNSIVSMMDNPDDDSKKLRRRSSSKRRQPVCHQCDGLLGNPKDAIFVTYASALADFMKTHPPQPKRLLAAPRPMKSAVSNQEALRRGSVVVIESENSEPISVDMKAEASQRRAAWSRAATMTPSSTASRRPRSSSAHDRTRSATDADLQYDEADFFPPSIRYRHPLLSAHEFFILQKRWQELTKRRQYLQRKIKDRDNERIHEKSSAAAAAALDRRRAGLERKAQEEALQHLLGMRGDADAPISTPNSRVPEEILHGDEFATPRSPHRSSIVSNNSHFLDDDHSSGRGMHSRRGSHVSGIAHHGPTLTVHGGEEEKLAVVLGSPRDHPETDKKDSTRTAESKETKEKEQRQDLVVAESQSPEEEMQAVLAEYDDVTRFFQQSCPVCLQCGMRIAEWMQKEKPDDVVAVFQKNGHYVVADPFENPEQTKGQQEMVKRMYQRGLPSDMRHLEREMLAGRPVESKLAHQKPVPASWLQKFTRPIKYKDPQSQHPAQRPRVEQYMDETGRGPPFLTRRDSGSVRGDVWQSKSTGALPTLNSNKRVHNIYSRTTKKLHIERLSNASLRSGTDVLHGAPAKTQADWHPLMPSGYVEPPFNRARPVPVASHGLPGESSESHVSKRDRQLAVERERRRQREFLQSLGFHAFSRGNPYQHEDSVFEQRHGRQRVTPMRLKKLRLERKVQRDLQKKLQKQAKVLAERIAHEPIDQHPLL